MVSSNLIRRGLLLLAVGLACGGCGRFFGYPASGLQYQKCAECQAAALRNSLPTELGSLSIPGPPTPATNPEQFVETLPVAPSGPKPAPVAEPKPIQVAEVTPTVPLTPQEVAPVSVKPPPPVPPPSEPPPVPLQTPTLPTPAPVPPVVPPPETASGKSPTNPQPTQAPAPLPPSKPQPSPEPVKPSAPALKPLIPAPRLLPQAEPNALAADSPTAPLRNLYRLAQERYAGMDSYICRLRRREQVRGKNHPQETILFKFRKEPFSVYFKWLEGEGKGREVVYVRGRFDSKIHTLTAAGDVPLLSGGKRISLDPTSPLVAASSRHPITEAGIGVIIDRFGNLIEALERGDRVGTVRYVGLVKRPEFPTPVEAVMHTVPPKSEAGLPRGGQRYMYFDTNLHLPVLQITQDDRGNEVEYSCHDYFLFPPGRFDDDEFNPEKLSRQR